MNQCPFLNQLRYCYASAEISAEQNLIKIKFNQELNISCGIEAVRFLLLPLCELSELDRCYTLQISTPTTLYLPCTVTMLHRLINIEQQERFGDFHQAS